MSKPDPNDPKNAYLNTPLSKTAATYQRPTSESARVPRRLMLDEDPDENDLITTTFADIQTLFDNPEKL